MIFKWILFKNGNTVQSVLSKSNLMFENSVSLWICTGCPKKLLLGTTVVNYAFVHIIVKKIEGVAFIFKDDLKLT